MATEALTYVLTITNAGPHLAEGVQVTDVLPAGLTVVSAQPSVGSCSGTTTLICELGALEVAAEETVTIVVTPTALGTLTNAVTVMTNGVDSDTTNNTAETTTLIKGGILVPILVGLTQADAEAAIVAANLTVGTVTTQASDTVLAGNVMTHDPIAGTNVAPGRSVNLVVSEGPDTDLDQVSDDIEDGSPFGGDGNQDGIQDSTQDNVASLPNHTDGNYVTLVSPPGTQLANVQAQANPSPGDAPAVNFPFGFLTFTVHGVEVGGATNVTLLLHGNTKVNTFYHYGPTPENPTLHWYEFLFEDTTGAEILPDQVVLHFVDGQRGDHDLLANGQIVDPGGPGQAPVAVPDVVGLSRTDAEAAILANDLLVGMVTPVTNQPFPLGQIASQDPQAGTGASLGSTVNLNIAAGRSPSLDVDADGRADAFTDGMLIARYLMGFTREALTSGVMNPAGIRTTPDHLIAFLASLRTTMLDVDCNGQAEALTDGMLIMRFMMGFQGSALIQDLVDPTGCRNTAPLIIAYLSQFTPGANTPPFAQVGPDQSVLIGTLATLDGSASVDLDGDPLTFAWSLIAQPPGSTAILSTPTDIMPTLVPDLPGEYVAQLLVHDGTVDSPPDTVTITAIDPLADLSISKADDVDPIIAGHTLTYSMTVHNTGPEEAANVIVTDTLPAGVTFVVSTGCAEDPTGVPTCVLGIIPAGGSASFTITVVVEAGTTGTLTNSATVAADTDDPDPTNNTITEDTVVTAQADLSLTKVEDVDPIIAGNTLTYTMTVSNAGPSDAANVVVTDTLPVGVTLVSTTGCAEDPTGVPTCTLGTIPLGGSASYTLTVVVDANTTGTITNTATVARRHRRSGRHK